MGIFNSLNVGVAGLFAQSNKLAVISDNIANVDTIGYKKAEANFSSIIALDNNTGVYSPGGVRGGNRLQVTTGGLLRPTNNGTDLGIAGDGMFVIKESTTSSAIRYTRAGAFTPNESGYLVNTAGFYLQGWRMNETGDLPPALSGTNIAANTAFGALESINISDLSADPIATTAIEMKANLKSSETAYAGVPAYNAADPLANMASGVITPHYIRPVNIVDNTGVSREFKLAFLKTGINTWATEFYTSTPADINSAIPGQVATGTIGFNGDGTLASVTGSITGNITIDWTSAANNNTITLDLGTAGVPFGTPGATVIGRTDGLYQFDAAYILDFLNQDGRVPGSLLGVTVDEEGYVSARYQNGVVRREFKIPLALFRNPDQLATEDSNIFSQGGNVADPFFTGTGQIGIGKIQANTLEQSNVELGTQLTDIIIAQRAYQANTKTISTSDEMLQRLDQMTA